MNKTKLNLKLKKIEIIALYEYLQFIVYSEIFEEKQSLKTHSFRTAEINAEIWVCFNLFDRLKKICSFDNNKLKKIQFEPTEALIFLKYQKQYDKYKNRSQYIESVLNQHMPTFWKELLK